MTVLNRIEEEVAGLSADDLVRFRAWFETFEAEHLDRQIENDARSVKLDALADAALAEHRAGRTRPL